MIEGNFYIGSAVRVTLETNLILTGATRVGVLVQKQGGTTLDIEADVVDLSKARILLTSEQVSEQGQYTLQAYAVLDGETFKGAPEYIVILPGLSAP